MSNLNRPYEISVWDDILEGEEFVEKRLGVIGSDKMLSQSRALNPQLGRNVNGTKTFQFEMYRYYTDNITGERVENPFSGWLISERKVKLKYAGKWHDFIIRDISENSSTYLYTYKLEDAAVIELSKNGFSVILDEQLNNNLGNPKTLAERVLEDTDWKVESEVIIQKVEDALVRVTIPVETTAVHLLDQTDLSKGVQETITTITKDGVDRVEVLAFYSSCTNKPHRFQFIYLDDLTKITTDKEGKINNSDCQYYIDFDSPDDNYYEVKNTAFFLPKWVKQDNGVDKEYKIELFGGINQCLYTDARAERYGFSHQTEYSPKLNRYIYKYTNQSKEERYGYYDSEYFSPTIIQNIVTNTRFNSTTGWTGTKTEKDKPSAVVRNVYGHFDNGSFIDSADAILDGTFDASNSNLSAYLEIEFKDDSSLVINSGPTDNRIITGNMDLGTEWFLDAEIRDSNNNPTQDIKVWVGEYEYFPDDDYYKQDTTFITFDDSNPSIYKVSDTKYIKESFKKDSKIRIGLTSTNINKKYYIKKFDFFRLIRNDDANKTIIKPNDYKTQADYTDQSVVKNTYKYFTKGQLEDEATTSEENLKFEYQTEVLSYKDYKPVYNIGAEKIRSVSAKESNYFNILQSIAETFGVWLEIDVKHNEDGSINKEEKWIRFKNYVGKNNYANFRYGVNLKDIQRTYASKEIVTKLMVKQNSNQHAKNGFCAIGRANSNPTGEDYIYDFRYFHDTGLLKSRDYLQDVYVYDSTKPDYNTTSGYYYKIKDLNNQITNINNTIIIPAQSELTTLESNYAVAEAGYESAIENIKKVRESFIKLTGIPIDNITEDDIVSINITKDNSYGETDHDGKIYHAPSNYFEVTNVSPSKDITTKKWKLIVDIKIKDDDSSIGQSGLIKFFPKLKLSDGTVIVKQLTFEFKIETINDTSADVLVGGPIDQTRTDVMKKITEYTTYLNSKDTYELEQNNLKEQIDQLKEKIAKAEAKLKELKQNKTLLNKTFFSKYCRFIQEGTWIDEKYSDNELYYADALSVMYNSCYPKVAYTINVLALNMLPGYEGFTFELGDATYAEDPEFFNDKKEEVVITEFIEFLDEPDKDAIKVQNFKNQFKDLFQKITATVQQAQYSTGSYEKAVALAEANQARKQQFLSDALNSATARLSAAGQQSVVWDNTGLTITDIDTPSNQIKMIGGAILLKKQDEKGQEKWTTGITSDGISADLITAGTINAGEIAIMNANDPVFRWDAFGITAYDYKIIGDGTFGAISDINTTKFVRFDKYGIYGIAEQVDGMSWYASGYRKQDDTWVSPNQQIQELATFALTWEGLKIVGQNGGQLMIGKGVAKMPTKEGYVGLIMGVTNINNEFTFGLTEDGDVYLKGEIEATKGFIGGWNIDNSSITSYDSENPNKGGGLVLYGSNNNSKTGTGDKIVISAGSLLTPSETITKPFIRSKGPTHKADTIIYSQGLSYNPSLETVTTSMVELKNYKEYYQAPTFSRHGNYYKVQNVLNKQDVIQSMYSHLQNNWNSYMWFSPGMATDYNNMFTIVTTLPNGSGFELVEEVADYLGLEHRKDSTGKYPIYLVAMLESGAATASATKYSLQIYYARFFYTNSTDTDKIRFYKSYIDAEYNTNCVHLIHYNENYGPMLRTNGYYRYLMIANILKVDREYGNYYVLDAFQFEYKSTINAGAFQLSIDENLSQKKKDFQMKLSECTCDSTVSGGMYLDSLTLSKNSLELNIVQSSITTPKFSNTVQSSKVQTSGQAKDYIVTYFWSTLNNNPSITAKVRFPIGSINSFLSSTAPDTFNIDVNVGYSVNSFNYYCSIIQDSSVEMLSDNWLASTSIPEPDGDDNTYTFTITEHLDNTNYLTEIEYTLIYDLNITRNIHYPFVLTDKGTLYASDAEISGNLITDSISLKIDGQLKENEDGVWCIPIQQIIYNTTPYVIYVTCTVKDDTGIAEFESIGVPTIIPLETWKNWEDVET